MRPWIWPRRWCKAGRLVRSFVCATALATAAYLLTSLATDPATPSHPGLAAARLRHVDHGGMHNTTGDSNMAGVMDHSQMVPGMDHSQMAPGMDHSSMQAGATPPSHAGHLTASSHAMQAAVPQCRPRPAVSPPRGPGHRVLPTHAGLHDIQRLAVSGRGPGSGSGIFCVQLEEDVSAGQSRTLSLAKSHSSRHIPGRRISWYQIGPMHCG